MRASRDVMVFGYHSTGDSEYHFCCRHHRVTNRTAARTKNPQTAESYDSGGRDEGGITISRRPNKRPSRENAPGPSKEIATAVMIIQRATSLASCMPQKGAGSHEMAIPRKHSPTKSPASGVRNPAVSATPLAIKAKPSSHLLEEGLEGLER
jgi:hypothetical protein